MIIIVKVIYYFGSFTIRVSVCVVRVDCQQRAALNETDNKWPFRFIMVLLLVVLLLVLSGRREPTQQDNQTHQTLRLFLHPNRHRNTTSIIDVQPPTTRREPNNKQTNRSSWSQQTSYLTFVASSNSYRLLFAVLFPANLGGRRSSAKKMISILGVVVVVSQSPRVAAAFVLFALIILVGRFLQFDTPERRTWTRFSSSPPWKARAACQFKGLPAWLAGRLPACIQANQCKSGQLRVSRMINIINHHLNWLSI